jgi:hypothetical protein
VAQTQKVLFVLAFAVLASCGQKTQPQRQSPIHAATSRSTSRIQSSPSPRRTSEAAALSASTGCDIHTVGKAFYSGNRAKDAYDAGDWEHAELYAQEASEYYGACVDQAKSAERDWTELECERLIAIEHEGQAVVERAGRYPSAAYRAPIYAKARNFLQTADDGLRSLMPHARSISLQHRITRARVEIKQLQHDMPTE